jgi:hypothetical protein
MRHERDFLAGYVYRAVLGADSGCTETGVDGSVKNTL